MIGFVAAAFVLLVGASALAQPICLVDPARPCGTCSSTQPFVQFRECDCPGGRCVDVTNAHDRYIVLQCSGGSQHLRPCGRSCPTEYLPGFGGYSEGLCASGAPPIFTQTAAPTRTPSASPTPNTAESPGGGGGCSIANDGSKGWFLLLVATLVRRRPARPRERGRA